MVEIVSRKMASNDIDGLGEMMNAETFGQIKQNLPRFSADQRQELATDQNDIYFTAPAAMNFVNGNGFANTKIMKYSNNTFPLII